MLYLSLSVLLFASLVRSHALQSRKAREDNALICFPDAYTSLGLPFWHNLPPPTSSLWPSNHPLTPTTYKTLRDLCAWSPKGPPSLGCVCFDHESEMPKHECKLEYADPTLWASERLLEICINACKCPSNFQPEKGRTIFNIVESIASSEADTEEIYPSEDEDGSEGGSDGGRSSDGGFHPVFNFGGSQSSQRTSRTRGSRLGGTLKFAQPVCGSRCRGSDFRCARGGSNCVCEAKAVGRGLWDIAGCVSAIGSTLGRRDGGLVCPCNSTYVSAGCCQAERGLVWEDINQKRGVLDLRALEH